MTDTDRWNHNIHYHPVILASIPDGARRALDVGCGDGTLARQLRGVVPDVMAIDLDRHSVELARAARSRADIDYLLGDFLAHPFAPASFDLVASVAALHHMDAATALSRMRELLRPGGTLAIVGLARSVYPLDLPIDFAGTLAHRFHLLTKRYWQHPSPIAWPPPETFAGMRRLAAEHLPGARYQRHLLWRYSITWTKPDC